MEKIKRRTIRFRRFSPKSHTKTSIVAGGILAGMVTALCAMLVYLFS